MCVVAAGGSEQGFLFLGLHPFRNHLHIELVRHHDDGLAQCHVVGTGRQVADEGLVDLEVVDVEFLEVGQRRVAGTEIIDRNLDTGVAELQQSVSDQGAGIQQQPFGDFNRDALPGQAEQIGRASCRERV